MTTDLHGRDFLKEVDFTPGEWAYLLDLAAELKETSLMSVLRVGHRRCQVLGNEADCGHQFCRVDHTYRLVGLLIPRGCLKFYVVATLRLAP